MSICRRDDLDEESLRRLLSDEKLAALWELVGQTSALLFDSVAGEGCWQSEFSDEQRRVICLRIMVRMVGELFKPDPSPNSRSSPLH
jgi:hypothetical protein